MNSLVHKRVEQVLRDDRGARNSDGRLIALYIYHFHRELVKDDGTHWIKLEDIAHDQLDCFESITRARRLFQAQDMYISDEQIKKGRKDKAEQMRVEMRQPYDN